MYRILSILVLLLPLSTLADEKADELIKHTEFMMVDILCSTTVVKEMNTADNVYEEQTKKANSDQEKLDLKLKFSKNLRQIWLKHNFDLSPYPDVVNFFNHLINAPMEVKFEFADLWAKSAQQQCPVITFDHIATTSAAMTIISSIAN
jgi:hypothetical protein